MKVTVKLREWDDLWTEPISRLKNITDVSIAYNDNLPDVSDSDILITTNLTREELNHFPLLRALFLPKSGLDKIPMNSLRNKDIFVHNSHANAPYIAEHAVALALALTHKIVALHEALKIGEWFSGSETTHLWKSIRDMRIGILGYGHIGKCIHTLIKPFTQEVKCLNRRGEYPEGVDYAENLSDLVCYSDLIFLCLPLNEGTKRIFNEGNIGCLTGKMLVNVGRAEVFDEKSLYSSLESGAILGYASDVWFKEPSKDNVNYILTLPSSYPFHELNNVVLSPHCATHVSHAKSRYIEETVQSCLDYIVNGEKTKLI